MDVQWKNTKITNHMTNWVHCALLASKCKVTAMPLQCLIGNMHISYSVLFTLLLIYLEEIKETLKV